MRKRREGELLEEAKRLAAQPYSIEYDIDDLTDGTTVVTAYHPELPGCMSDGSTKEEAAKNLADARLIYIEHLLEYDVLVPEPHTPFILKSERVNTFDFSRRTWIPAPVRQVVNAPDYIEQSQFELVKA